jgi:hypothetical protein
MASEMPGCASATGAKAPLLGAPSCVVATWVKDLGQWLIRNAALEHGINIFVRYSA